MEEGEELFSSHRHIYFTVATDMVSADVVTPKNIWNMGTLKSDHCKDAIINHPETDSSEDMSKRIRKLCADNMKMTERGPHRRRPVYW